MHLAQTVEPFGIQTPMHHIFWYLSVLVVGTQLVLAAARYKWSLLGLEYLTLWLVAQEFHLVFSQSLRDIYSCRKLNTWLQLCRLQHKSCDNLIGYYGQYGFPLRNFISCGPIILWQSIILCQALYRLNASTEVKVLDAILKKQLYSASCSSELFMLQLLFERDKGGGRQEEEEKYHKEEDRINESCLWCWDMSTGWVSSHHSNKCWMPCILALINKSLQLWHLIYILSKPSYFRGHKYLLCATPHAKKINDRQCYIQHYAIF